MSIFDRVITDNSDNCDNSKGDYHHYHDYQLSQPQITPCLHIHRVLAQLRDIGLHRIGERLKIRYSDRATLEQRQLIRDYQRELLRALSPRELTSEESEQLALWLHNTGEAKKPIRFIR